MFQNSKIKEKDLQNFHKTCSHHANLCSQKNQTLMHDWGNSIKIVREFLINIKLLSNPVAE
jgi:hypothetical protein